MVPFFFTRNSSVVLIFSFFKTFFASPQDPQDTRGIDINNKNNIFIYLLFTKKSFAMKVIIPKVMNMSAKLNVNQWKFS